MADSFDPYHKWLGIPPEEQPPHHYRLLAIKPLEEDPDVIVAAADARMAFLRTLQTGKRSIFSERLLGEVARARATLLDPEKKEAYDRELQNVMQRAAAEVLPSIDMLEGNIAEEELATTQDSPASANLPSDMSVAVVKTSSTRVSRHRGRKKVPKEARLLAVGAAVGLLAVFVIGMFVWNGLIKSAAQPRTEHLPGQERPASAKPPKAAEVPTLPAPSQPTQHDYATLVANVRRIVSTGAPGPIEATTSDWVTVADGGTEVSEPSTFALARCFGTGRVVAMGHEGILGNPHLLDNGEFLLNLFRWLDKRERKRVRYSTGHREWANSEVLIPLQQILEAEGYDFGPAPFPLSQESLHGCGVLIVGNAWGAFVSSEIRDVEAFCNAGGGLLLPGLGWSWCQHHPDDTMGNYPMMKMAAPFGVRWLTGSIYGRLGELEGSPILQVQLPPESPR